MNRLPCGHVAPAPLLCDRETATLKRRMQKKRSVPVVCAVLEAGASNR